METSPNLALPYLMAAQAQKHVTHNEAIGQLDVLVQAAVKDRHLSVPPSGPAEGDAYIVASGGTGAWSGWDDSIAAFQNSAWVRHVPNAGWRCFAADEGAIVYWDGMVWAELVEALSFAKLGVNAAADATNRLAVNAEAILFNRETDDLRIKLNKEAAGDTASVLFQTGFSGRAEIGLTGDDNFHLKVSPDGQQFQEALRIDKSTGEVVFPSGGELKAPQVGYAEKTDQFETNSTTYVDVPGLELTITPRSIDSKILLLVFVSGSSKDGFSGYVKLSRNGNEILSGDGSAIANPSGGSSLFLDVGSTQEWTIPTRSNAGVDEPQTLQPVTYKLQARCGAASEPVYINQNHRKVSASNYLGVPASRIIALEIMP